ncbi:acetate kinase [Falsarthrobacter nasiphocae]|uniref:Acetate kinase n=1 Tax=Falsarthrobacter nasiphocae TaxID=189863 RepID=A0AAE4C5S3_9MICC|nr:acetate kinase [Falsarthrobacter nasiphocae]MDR6891382.1 acetate kinase [Falsarthrobacter nasiphocae]
MLVLVVNSGSSSIKYQVRDTDTQEVLAKGLIESIGTGGLPDHAAGLDLISERLEDELGGREIDAVGHRVVHGGERFAEPVVIDNEIIRAIERLSTLAPLHNPAAALGIRAITEKWPHMPQVAVFDTAYHRTIPEHAWRYAVPNEWYTLYGMRRYGFHGTSHEFVARQTAEFLGMDLADFDGVVAHVGNGASVTAVKGGESIDTSMGYTPLAGLVMGTRTGDVDPSVLLAALRQVPGISSAEDLDRVLNKQSGLTALAGTNDMREIQARSESGDEAAQMAAEIASYRLAQYIGSYHVVVGGAKAIAFTAGIGENSAFFRKATVDRLGALGIVLDDAANAVRSDDVRVISTPESAIPVLVVPTDEEQAIAEATRAALTSA